MALVNPPRDIYGDLFRKWCESVAVKLTAPIYTVKYVDYDYTVTITDCAIIVDTTSGDITITLPLVDSAPLGRVIEVKKTSSDSNNVILDGEETIDGAASLSFSTQYAVRQVVAGSSEWHVFY